MPELLLGLDVGTSSVRALIVDPSGRVHGVARSRLASSFPAPGRVEQDPRALWKSVEATIAEALAAAGRRGSDLAAVGIAAQRSSILVWERASGEALGPMVVWSDLRGVARAAELRAAGELAPELAAVSKLEAAIDACDPGRARTARGELAWGTVDSFLAHRLSAGDLHVTDYSNAWSTGYLDMQGFRDWNQRVIALQRLSELRFPMLCNTYGELGRCAAGASVLGAEVPLCAIVADQQSGMFAHGAWEAGAWKATFGTSATLLRSTGSEPTLAAGLTPMLLCGTGERNTFAVEGMVLSAGSVLDWFVRDLRLFDSVEALGDAAAAAASAGGISIRPSLQGLGAPHHDPHRRAAIVGLSGASTREEIARAIFEGLAFRMREVAKVASEIEGLPRPTALPVDGGLAKSDVFMQLQADLLGLPIHRHHELEATALGACIAAALGSGIASESDLRALTRTDRHFEPRIGREEAETRFEVWREALG